MIVCVLVAALAALTAFPGCTAKSTERPSAEIPASEAPADPAEPTPTQTEEERFSFRTTDVNGSPIAFSDFSDKKVIMVNFWETWCPPCMGEIPELVELYEKYKDEGFLLLGVFSNSEEPTVRSTVMQYGISYPVLAATEDFTPYQTEYVPTTVFFNGSGEQLGGKPYIGALSGEDWEAIITGFLGD